MLHTPMLPRYLQSRYPLEYAFRYTPEPAQHDSSDSPEKRFAISSQALRSKSPGSARGVPWPFIPPYILKLAPNCCARPPERMVCEFWNNLV